MISIDITKCTGDAGTCLTLQDVLAIDNFYEAVEDLDPQASDIREMLGDFATSCSQGRCIGCNQGIAKQVLQDMMNRDEGRGPSQESD